MLRAGHARPDRASVLLEEGLSRLPPVVTPESRASTGAVNLLTRAPSRDSLRIQARMTARHYGCQYSERILHQGQASLIFPLQLKVVVIRIAADPESLIELTA